MRAATPKWRADDPALARLKQGDVKLVGAVYDLGSGRVRFLEPNDEPRLAACR
jgi:hypothetical protein